MQWIDFSPAIKPAQKSSNFMFG